MGLSLAPGPKSLGYRPLTFARGFEFFNRNFLIGVPKVLLIESYPIDCHADRKFLRTSDHSGPLVFHLLVDQ